MRASGIGELEAVRWTIAMPHAIGCLAARYGRLRARMMRKPNRPGLGAHAPRCCSCGASGCWLPAISMAPARDRGDRFDARVRGRRAIGTAARGRRRLVWWQRCARLYPRGPPVHCRGGRRAADRAGGPLKGADPGGRGHTPALGCSRLELGPEPMNPHMLSSSEGWRATLAKTCSASMRPSPSAIAAAASGESWSRSTIARDSQRTASWACSTSDGGSRVRRAASRSGAAVS